MLVSVCGGNIISELQEQPDSQSRDAGAGAARARARARLSRLMKFASTLALLLLVCDTLTDPCLRAKFVSC